MDARYVCAGAAVISLLAGDRAHSKGGPFRATRQLRPAALRTVCAGKTAREGISANFQIPPEIYQRTETRCCSYSIVTTNTSPPLNTRLSKFPINHNNYFLKINKRK